MKKFKHLIWILAAAIVMQFPASTYADTANTTYSPFVKANYTQQERMASYTIVHGLDLSYHNGDVNFAKLKKAGVEYVILRVGYRGYGEKGSIGKDKLFETYYNAARAQGLDIGVYFYSQALNESEAKVEANYTLERIKGLKMDLPVYYDYEFAGVSDGRLDKAWSSGKLNKAKMTANVKAFCETVKNAGYVPGVYSNTDFLNNKYYSDQLDSIYSVWNAHYTAKKKSGVYASTTYTGQYQMWQYSSTGTVPGTESTYVDSNFMYKELMQAQMGDSPFIVSAITSRAYTGKEIKPALEVKAYGKDLVKGEDYFVTFENNIEIGKAYVTVTGVNDYATAKSVKKAFYIVPSKVTDLKATSSTSGSVTFGWDKHGDATKYRIQQLDGTAYKTVKETTDTSYTATLSPCESITLRVCAVKVIGGKEYVGKYSTPIETAAKAKKVAGLKNTTKNTDSIRLQWTNQPHASYYNVYEYNEKTQKYELLWKASKNYYTVKNLKIGSRHKFKVRAYKKLSDGTLINGAASDAFTAYTSPAKPEIKSATSASARKINVKWNKADGADGYEIMWSTTKGFTSNYLSVYTTSQSAVSKVLTTAQSSKTYYVRVRAYNNIDGLRIYSAWSKTLSVKVK
ncbi:MAG: hypothetical protein E7571_07055 [Ruminococcaceae bacterium]|nr:hypothetical protein [Oscillospiraceae bacterium]